MRDKVSIIQANRSGCHADQVAGLIKVIFWLIPHLSPLTPVLDLILQSAQQDRGGGKIKLVSLKKWEGP